MRQHSTLPFVAFSLLIGVVAAVVLWGTSLQTTEPAESGNPAPPFDSRSAQREKALSQPRATLPLPDKPPLHRKVATPASPSEQQRSPTATVPSAGGSSEPEAEKPPRSMATELQDILGPLFFRTPLEHPAVWRVPPAGGSPPKGSADQDLVVLPNTQHVPIFGPVRIEGYRTVVAANLTLVPLASMVVRSSAALTVVRTSPGVVIIASSSIDTRRADTGAVFLDARNLQADPTRIIIASSSLTVLDSRNAVGAFSWRGRLKRIEVLGSTVASNNLGIRLAPAASGDVLEEAFLRNVRLMRTHTRLEQGRLLAVWSPYGTALRNITLEDVWVLPQKGVSLGELVFPGHILPQSLDPTLALTVVRGKSGARSFGVWTFPSVASGEPLVRGVLRYGNPPK